jgi:enamine deaminase RidA (YjgF/YER057c/UK114 family)
LTALRPAFRIANDVGERSDRVRDGLGWEAEAGYSRAARRGNLIAVSGTTATGPDGAALYPGDTFAQTRDALERALNAVKALGGGVDDILRSRLYLAPGADWVAAGRAHREVLGRVAPANTTLYVAGLIGKDFLVEVELEAVLASSG